MVRVLHVNRSMHRGGIETFIINLYSSLDREKIQFDFLLNVETGDYIETIKKLGGHIYVLPPRNKGYFLYLKNLNDFFSSHTKDYCAIHLHDSSLSMIEPLYFAKKYGIKNRIIHIHSTKQKGIIHYILHNINKLVIDKVSNYFYACSDTAKNWAFKYSRIYDKVKIIKNGIPVSKFKFSVEKRIFAEKALKINNNDKIIGLVANLIPVKNHIFLIEVFKQYHLINNNSKLILVGSGALDTQLKAMVKKINLNDSVQFLGARSDIDVLLQRFDAFIMPSLWEGLPVSLIEAQTSGIPVFCSDTISKMCKIIPYFYFLKLSDGPEFWARFVDTTLKNIHRQDMSKYIIEAGFDILSIAEEIYKDYTRI